MADYQEIIRELLEIPDREQRVEAIFLRGSDQPSFNIPEIARYLKETVIADLRTNGNRALQEAELVLDLAEAAQDVSLQALGHRLVAQAHLICFGETGSAQAHYDRSIALYSESGDELGRAETAITHIWALALVGEYPAAVQEAEWAAQVFDRLGETRSLATILNNLAMIHLRAGSLSAAIQALERSAQMYRDLGDEGRPFLVNNATNQALVLADLGRFNDSIRTSEEAGQLATQLGQPLLLARARQNLAVTYRILGHYNRALRLLNEARDDWATDGRLQEVQQCDLAATYCLLALRRFEEVIEKCASIRTFFSGHGAEYETAETYLLQAKAEAELGRPDCGVLTLQAGKKKFLEMGSPLGAAQADLVSAALLLRQEKWQEALDLSRRCAQVFSDLDDPREEAVAWLHAARAHLHLGNPSEAARSARSAEALSRPREIAGLNYQADYLLGRAAEEQDRRAEAAACYRRGIEELDRLQGLVMVEHRADFLAGGEKKALYEAAVAIALKDGDLLAALNDIERAKSRALRDILAHRIDLRIRARGPEDTAFVQEFNELLAQRNSLLRRMARASSMGAEKPEQDQLDAIRDLERQIEALRSRWLVDRADYSEQPDFFHRPNVGRALAALSPETAVLAYFNLGDRLVAFLVSRGEAGPVVEVTWLSGSSNDIRRAIGAMRVNFAAAAYGDPQHIPGLTRQAQGILRRLYGLLLEPLAERLQAFENLVIVPHGLLHYLPFHALFDGDRYLLETHRVSYLPGVSFLESPEHPTLDGERVLAVGSSFEGRLPHTAAEAEQVAAFWDSAPLLEEAAALQAVRERMPASRLVHCAAHAEFRADNPLFSGIALADGWLTTLDLFNLELRASLVTLSACSTGRSVPGEGEELQGFIRALLAAGAASLLLSQWAVDDASTAQWMGHFYSRLRAGAGKAEALQEAGCAFIQGQLDAAEAVRWAHPYFWAPFYLVGRTGEL